MVACLIPLRAVVNPYLFSQVYAVVRLFADEDAPLTVMHMALIRDCLMGADQERLKNACSCPCWTVASDEFSAGHCFTSYGESCPAPTWKVQTSHSSSQIGVNWPSSSGYSPPVASRTPSPAGLPGRVTFDLSHYHPQSLPAPTS